MGIFAQFGVRKPARDDGGRAFGNISKGARSVPEAALVLVSAPVALVQGLGLWP